MNGCHENLARSGEREIRERLADQRLSRGYTVPDVRAVPCQTFLIRSAVSGGREPPKKKKKKKKREREGERGGKERKKGAGVAPPGGWRWPGGQARGAAIRAFDGRWTVARN